MLEEFMGELFKKDNLKMEEMEEDFLNMKHNLETIRDQ